MKNLLSRVYDLIIKLISVKGLVFFVATILLLTKGLDNWVWFFSAVALISLRTLEKIFKK